MLVAIAYHPGDEEQFHRWAEWCAELGGCETHHLVVLPFKGLTAPEIKGWASVTVLRDYSGVKSDWSAPGEVRDAAGPNFMFRELANHVYSNRLGRWLFMESDAIFLHRNAINEIEAEDRQSGKRYMGADVQWQNAPRHMSGIAVYPQDLPIVGMRYMQPQLAMVGGRQVEVAFNISGAPDALQNFHATRLIQDEYRYPGFTQKSELDALIENGRAVFHSDKSQSLISMARTNSVGAASAQSKTAARGLLVPPLIETVQTALSTPREPTISDHIAALVEASRKDGFAKGRIVKQLKAAGIFPRR